MGYALLKTKKDSGMSYTGNDIIEAAKVGNVKQVREILSVDPSLVNAQEEDTKMTCLHYAGFNSDKDLVDALFEVNEIKPRVFDRFFRTPLDMTHITKNEDMIVYMREKCLPPQFSSELPDDNDGFDIAGHTQKSPSP